MSDLRQALRHLARASARRDRRAARGGRSCAVGGQAGEDVLRRHAAAARDRARPGARAADLLPRRADHRPRSRVARRRVGDARSRPQRERDLTILLTTHYMDEADKLCDRIAIVDHGKLVALDSPLKLKASIPGKNMLEVSFSTCPPAGRRAAALPEVADVGAEDVFRISSDNGPRTTVALHGGGAAAPRRSRSCRCPCRARRSTTCSCTTPAVSCATRCRAANPAESRVHRPPLTGEPRMHRIWAIIERDLRRFRRSPALVVVSMIMPLVQLVMLGHAFGGKVRNLESASSTRTTACRRSKLKEMFQAVAANARTFDTRAVQRRRRRAGRPAQRQDQRRRQHPADVLPQAARRRRPDASR